VTHKQIIQELLDQGCNRHQIEARTGLTSLQISRAIYYINARPVKPLVKPRKTGPEKKKLINSVWALG
jgi:hypothetical protein